MPAARYSAPAFPGVPVFLLLLSLLHAEDLWATGAVEGVRWPDVTAVSVTLAQGDRVEVLAREGDKVRVRKGTDFGWVPAASLTEVEPPKVEGLPGGLPTDFPGFQIPGGTELPVMPK